MSTPLADCPTDETLAKYLDDGLSPTVSGPLTAHIDGCPACQTKLDELTTGGGVSDRLKALSSVLLRAPDDTQERGVVATTATDTQVFGRDGIPLVPRVQVVRPQVPGYEVDLEIGRGGMGVVFKAQHKRLNRTVALKMVLAAGVADPRVTQRFLFEAEVLAKVQHPQVVQVYEVNMFTAPTGVVFPYLAMELLPAGTLIQWAAGRVIPPGEAAEMIEGLARAVHAVHQQGIVHRDLKPANILKSADGVFKVSDFGLAKLTVESGAHLTGTGMVVGTPAYMAPEQAGGEGPIGPPADVYSLGAMLFELLAGHPPFPGDDAMSVLLRVIRDPAPDVRTARPDVPRDLAAVVMKCLNKEAARRYQSADDLADDLRRFLNRRPTRARTLSAVERVWYWARRNPHVASLLTGLAVAITAGFVSTFILWQRAEGETDKVRREAKKTDDARQLAVDSQREADKSRAYLTFDQAVKRCEAGYVKDGLRQFVAALELAERLGDAPLTRVIRTNIAAWETELPVLRHAFDTSGRVGADRVPDGEWVVGTGYGRPREGTADAAADGHFTAADLSPDGRWVVAGVGGERVLVWDTDTGEVVHTFTVPPSSLDLLPGRRPWAFRDVTVDKDRRWVAACTTKGELVVWSAADGVGQRELAVGLLDLDNSLWQVAFAGDRLWVGGGDGLLHGYDLKVVEQESGKAVTVTRARSLRLPGASRHPLGTAAVGGGTTLLLDAALRTSSVQSLRASADGKRLYTGDRAGRVIEWDPVAGLPTAGYSFGHWAWVYGLAESADTRFVAACSVDGTARMWRREDLAMLFGVTSDGAEARGLGLSADGRRMVVGNGDGRVVTYDTKARLTVGTVSRQMELGPLAVRTTSDGQLLVLAAKRDTLLLSELPGPKHTFVSVGPSDYAPRPEVRFLDFRPDGHALAVGCGQVYVCDPASGQQLAGPLGGEEPLGGRFSEDGHWLVFGTRHWCEFYRRDERERYRLQPPSVSYPSGYLRVFPGRPNAATAFVSRDKIWQYDTAAANGIRRMTGRWQFDHVTGIKAGGMTASNDCGEWRIAHRDTVEFEPAVPGKPSRTPLRMEGTVTRLAQTPDGNTLAVLVADETARLFDLSGGTARPLPGKPIPVRHRGAVSGMALSRDGRVLVTASRDHTLQFWDTETGLALGPRRTHDSPVTALEFSPVNNEVAVGTGPEMRAAGDQFQMSSTGVTVVWQAPPPPTTLPLAKLIETHNTESGLSPPAGSN